jgi:hypothetical protein
VGNNLGVSKGQVLSIMAEKQALNSSPTSVSTQDPNRFLWLGAILAFGALLAYGLSGGGGFVLLIAIVGLGLGVSGLLWGVRHSKLSIIAARQM